jgi:quercetin dioxygenase-like cupin family protein
MVNSWDLVDFDVEFRKPQVIGAAEDGRAVLVNLPAGESLSEHQVKERATIIVVAGQIEIRTADGQSTSGNVGTMVVFDPEERHAVRANEDSRFLLLLSPWSLEDHSSILPWSRGDG